MLVWTRVQATAQPDTGHLLQPHHLVGAQTANGLRPMFATPVLLCAALCGRPGRADMLAVHSALIVLEETFDVD